MSKEEKLSQIYELLLEDALQADASNRYFKLNDKDLLSIINAMSENWTPKQVRSTLRDQTAAPKTLPFEND